MKRLLVLLFLLAGCQDEVSGACSKEGHCCPDSAANGVPCGQIREICGVLPMGSCTCTIEHTWSCFGTQDLSLYFPDLRSVEGDL